jgi:C-terminal processing protease CtpA/Prc
MGTGHLWLRIDQPGGKVSFLNNMSNNPITKPNWKGYEIYGSVDSLAVRIYFGAFLVGNGEFNVDDIKLSAGDGKNFTEIPVQYGDFNAESIDELKKVWYSGNQEYKYALINNGIGGKYLSISKTPVRDTLPGSKLFEAEPVFGEVVNEQINNNISCIVPLVLYCNESGTYPAVNAEKFLEKLSATDKNSFGLPLRVADVIIVWNIFQHFYPYMESAGTDWNIELEKALYRCFSDKTEFDFLATLRIMTAALKDGHIHLNYSKDLNYYLPPIAWDIIEGKLVITKVYDESLPLHPGDIVSGIDGKDPVTYFGREAQTISASTSGWLDYRLRSATLFGSKDSKLMITVNNEQLELTRNQTQYIQNLKDNEKAVTFSDLGDGVFYMNMDKADMKIIEGLMPKLTSAKAIICDLRGYPVNSIKFISHLLNKETHTKWMFIPQYIYPDQKRVTGYREFGWDLKPEKPHINAKIIFITDGRAISYAESYIGMIQGNKLAVIIGEPTAGTNGNINPFTLPGGYSTAWTGMKVLKHDGSKLHGVGFLPDIYMSKTIEGVRESRDEFLEKAIKIAKEKL